MLTQDQTDTLLECLEALIVQLVNRTKNQGEVLEWISATDDLGRLKAHLTGCSDRELWLAACRLYGLRHAAVVGISGNTIHVQPMDLKAGHVPLNLHTINPDFTPEDLSEFVERAVSNIREALGQPQAADWIQHSLRETADGIYYGARDVYMMVRHPVTTAKALGSWFVTPKKNFRDLRTAVTEEMKKHPVRFVVQQVTTMVIVGGVARGVTKGARWAANNLPNCPPPAPAIAVEQTVATAVAEDAATHTVPLNVFSPRPVIPTSSLTSAVTLALARKALGK